GVDRAVLAAGLRQLFAGLVGEDDVARVEAERFEVRTPEWRRRPQVQDARDADAHVLALRRQLGRAAAERALDVLADHASGERLLDLHIRDRRARLGHRRRREEALEAELGLVIDEVRVLLHAALALLVELLQSVEVLDRALLAREARDVAGALAVEGRGVDERARAVV